MGLREKQAREIILIYVMFEDLKRPPKKALEKISILQTELYELVEKDSFPPCTCLLRLVLEMQRLNLSLIHI